MEIGTSIRYAWCRATYRKHVPPSARSDRDLIASLEQRIQENHGKLRGYSSEDARRAYVSTCIIPVYGAAYFEAKPKTTEYPSQVVLAVTAASLLVVDPSSRAVLKSFSSRFPVVTWGHSSSSFVVVEGDEVHHTKGQFATQHGRG